MSKLKIFKDMEANCANCPFGITEGDIKKCYNDCGDKPNECYECNYLEYYLKSEADKVIAEKNKVIAHNMYKRCLAMARWCKRNRVHVSVCGPIDKIDFWEKWHKRWEALAEEPTWKKFLQLIRKEVK